MAKCSVCGGDGPMIVMHSSCLYDLLEAVCFDDALLCKLCGNTEPCRKALQKEIEQGKPMLFDCERNFRLDPAKVQAILQEVTAND